MVETDDKDKNATGFLISTALAVLFTLVDSGIDENEKREKKEKNEKREKKQKKDENGENGKMEKKEKNL